MMNTEFETTILGGLPVLVRAEVLPPDPEVGIFGAYAEELEIYWPKGKTMLTDKVLNRLGEDDWEVLRGEAVDAADGGARGRYSLYAKGGF